MYLFICPAGGLHLCLEAKTKQKVQGCFFSSLIIFIQAKFGQAISLSFDFDDKLDKKRPVAVLWMTTYSKVFSGLGSAFRKMR